MQTNLIANVKDNLDLNIWGVWIYDIALWLYIVEFKMPALRKSRVPVILKNGYLNHANKESMLGSPPTTNIPQETSLDRNS